MHQLTLLLTFLLFTAANLLTSYLYLYPIAHGCAFPSPPPPPPPPLTRTTTDTPNTTAPYPFPPAAPFRLLLLGDPQLEGSTSLVDPSYTYLPALRTLWRDLLHPADPASTPRWRVLHSHLRDLYTQDLPILAQQLRKQLDLFGNDFYLAHIYRSLRCFTYPTHTAVLGDLLGSQWVDEEEFERRGGRFWGRVFSGGGMVGEDVTGGAVVSTALLPPGGGEGVEAWKRRVINVAGNHDVGYAGEMTFEQVQRFERVFGRVNWETRFTLPGTAGGRDGGEALPELKLVVLNSLNIDGPAVNVGLQSSTFKFMSDVVERARPLEDSTSATVLLTHLPLHKEAGVCVDAPMITYYGEDRGGGIAEQNHLSYGSSAGVLESVFGLGAGGDAPVGGKGSNGIIFTGHDHEGCDVYHHLPQPPSSAPDQPEARRWAAERWNASSASRHADVPGVREVTVRSMMGDFGGNAGLLSAWFDADAQKWEFEYMNCALGKPYLWWATHVLDIVALLMCVYTGVRLAVEASSGDTVGGGAKGEKQKTL